MMNVYTEKDFDKEVLQAENPVLVDFYADWCGPCKMMAPVVESLSAKYQGRAAFGKINVEQEASLAQRYKVVSIPTFLIFKNGQVAAKLMGAMGPDELSEKLDEFC